MRETPECMLDPFTAEIFKLSAESTLASDDWRAVLITLARSIRRSIHSVEVGHSRVRRRLKAASNKTWVQDVLTASAEYVLREHQRSFDLRQRLAGESLFSARGRFKRKAGAVIKECCRMVGCSGVFIN